jgi:hypothetical protein
MKELVEMVNEEIGLQLRDDKKKLDEVERQLISVSQKLLKYFTAFENGAMSEEDAGTRVKELRGEQVRLQKIQDEVLANIDTDSPAKLDTRQVAGYAEDMRALLAEGTLTEQKAILKSFVKRVDYETEKVTISYTIPMPVASDRLALEEVLLIEPNGRPYGSRTSNLLIKS